MTFTGEPSAIIPRSPRVAGAGIPAGSAWIVSARPSPRGLSACRLARSPSGSIKLTAFTQDRNLILFSHVRRVRAAWLLSAPCASTPGCTARRAAPPACPARCRDLVQRHGLAAVHDPGLGTLPRRMGRAGAMAQRRTGLARVRRPVHPCPEPHLRRSAAPGMLRVPQAAPCLSDEPGGKPLTAGMGPAQPPEPPRD